MWNFEAIGAFERNVWLLFSAARRPEFPTLEKYMYTVTLSCVFTVTPSKMKMQTSQYRKPRIWEMKEDEYTESLAKNQVCAIIHMGDFRKKRFTQIYKALYGDAMSSCVPLTGTNMAAGNQQKHLLRFLVFLLMHEFIA